MAYLMEVMVYTAAMAVIYITVLRNRPFYVFGRVWLLATAFLPIALPLLRLPTWLAPEVKLPSLIEYIMLPEVTAGSGHGGGLVSSPERPWLVYIYAGVSVLVLLRNFGGLVRIRRMVKESNTRRERLYTLLLSTGVGPGSFGRYIFFPGNEVDGRVLAHEYAHVIRRHSVDIILLSLLQVFCWPNLFLVWIKKELKEVHEFEADAIAADNVEQYAHTLLSAAFGVNTINLTHSFINQSIKRRIMMLSKNGSKGSPFKSLLLVSSSLLVVISLGLSLQSCKKYSESKKEAPNVVISPNYVYAKADVMPNFNGDLGSYLGSTLKYPEYAKSHGIEGRVIVKFTVTSEGLIANAQAVKSPDSSLTRAALAVVNSMPPWNPGQMKDGKKVDVWFYLPVLFKLS